MRSKPQAGILSAAVSSKTVGRLLYASDTRLMRFLANRAGLNLRFRVKKEYKEAGDVFPAFLDHAPQRFQECFQRLERTLDRHCMAPIPLSGSNALF